MAIISSCFFFLNAIYPMLEEQIYNKTGLDFEWALFIMFYITYMTGIIIALVRSIKRVKLLGEDRINPKYKLIVVAKICNLISTELMFVLGLLMMVITFGFEFNLIAELDVYTKGIVTLLILSEGAELYGKENQIGK